MCDCIAKLDEKLKPYNGKIALAILLPAEGSDALRSRVLVQTEKLDPGKRSKKLPAVMASYCPFCGEHVADAA